MDAANRTVQQPGHKGRLVFNPRRYSGNLTETRAPESSYGMLEILLDPRLVPACLFPDALPPGGLPATQICGLGNRMAVANSLPIAVTSETLEVATRPRRPHVAQRSALNQQLIILSRETWSRSSPLNVFRFLGGGGPWTK